MATTLTPRLNLGKQEVGDLDWETDLNQGFDDADARLILVRSVLKARDAPDDIDYGVDPEDGTDEYLPADFVGQIYVDDGIAGGLKQPVSIWIAHAIGTPTGGSPNEIWNRIDTDSVTLPYEDPGPMLIRGKAILTEILQELDTDLGVVEGTPAFPRGHLKGLKITKVDASNINVAEGQCRGGTSVDQDIINLPLAAMSKTLADGGWVAGAAGSALPDIVNPIAGTQLHVFVIEDDGTGTTIDWGVDTDIDATNLLAESTYTNFRRIGSIRCASATEMADDFRHGDIVKYVDMVDLGWAGNRHGATPTNEYMEVPIGVPVEAIFELSGYDSGNAMGFSIYTPGSTNPGTNIIGGPYTFGLARDQGNAAVITMLTNASGELTFRSESGMDLEGYTQLVHGYIDRRGQDD